MQGTGLGMGHRIHHLMPDEISAAKTGIGTGFSIGKAQITLVSENRTGHCAKSARHMLICLLCTTCTDGGIQFYLNRIDMILIKKKTQYTHSQPTVYEQP